MNTREVRKQTVVLKLWVRVFLACFMSAMFILSILMIFSGSKEKESSDLLYSYKKSSNVNYKVYLLENNFYENNYLEMGKQYPSALIDYIDLDLSYSHIGSLPANLNYTYYVEGTIIGNYENTENGKSELWTKKYNLMNMQTENSSSVALDLNKNLRINYQEYLRVVNEFKEKFRLSIDAYLNVKMYIRYDGFVTDINKPISESEVIEVNIPLNSSTIEIENKIPEAESKNITDTKRSASNPFVVIMGIIFIVMDTIIFMATYKYIFTSEKNEYVKTRDKYIKSYGEIMVEVEELPNVSELEIIEVKAFDDMIDLEEELKVPILYKETVYGRETRFVIVVDNYAYRHILRRK